MAFEPTELLLPSPVTLPLDSAVLYEMLLCRRGLCLVDVASNSLMEFSPRFNGADSGPSVPPEREVGTLFVVFELETKWRVRGTGRLPAIDILRKGGVNDKGKIE